MSDKEKQMCPCCGFPTLSTRAMYEICTICWWEDDGQDENNASKVFGGPNGKYALSDARLNFKKHGHMYDYGKGIEVVEKPSRPRQQLLEYVFSVIQRDIEINSKVLDDLIEKQR